MKILQKILLVILAIIAIPFIAALFVKNTYTVEREIVINKPKTEVFDYVKYLKNQNNYSKWAAMDTAMIKNYSGTDATPGFVSAWDSKKADVGKGEQEIKKITDGQRIDYEIRFMKPQKSTALSYITTDSIAPAQTKVKWGFYGNMKYPSNVMLLFLNFDKMVGNDLQTGLNNLKTIMEK